MDEDRDDLTTGGAPHRVVATRDPGEAARLLESAFPAARVASGPSDADAPFQFRHESVGDEALAVHRIRMTWSGTSTGSTGGVAVVGFARDPAIAWRLESGVDVDFTRPFLLPAGDFGSTWARLELELLTVGPDLVRAAARTLSGRDDAEVALLGHTPIEPAGDALWGGLRRQAFAVLASPALADSPIVHAELEHAIARAVLVTFPTTLSRPPQIGVALDRAVVRAEECLRAGADGVLSMDAVSRQAGAPIRPLVDAFRSRYGVTPMRYLRGLRLDGAQRELLASDPWSGSVAVVAHRWGFAHLGRFAAAYRERHGEQPSSTLRR